MMDRFVEVKGRKWEQKWENKKGKNWLALFDVCKLCGMKIFVCEFYICIIVYLCTSVIQFVYLCIVDCVFVSCVVSCVVCMLY